jgi:hypothetical protein
MKVQFLWRVDGRQALLCLSDILYEPREGLARIKSRTGWWWVPLSLIVVVTVTVWVYYYATVDLGWYVDQIIHENDGLSLAQQSAVQQSVHRSQLVWAALFKGTAAIFFWYAVQALYLFLASKVAGFEVQSYTAWFGFVAWTSLPSILTPIAACLAYLTAGTHEIFETSIDVTGLATLLGNELPDRWYSVVATVHVTDFWVLGLMIYGITVWTKLSVVKSGCLILIPYVLVYGIWAAIIAIQG